MHGFESSAFKNEWGDHKDAFNLAQHAKCAWCERKYTGYGDVEHILPKASVTVLGEHGTELATLKVEGRTTLSESKPGYWWAAYDWNNYCFACNHCNSKWKRNHLEVSPPHGVASLATPTRAEIVYLVLPYDDRPEEHLRVDLYGTMQALTKKGQGTIDVLGLNRPSLTQGRLWAYQDAAAAAESMDQVRMDAHLLPNREYTLARWWAIQDVLESLADPDPE